MAFPTAASEISQVVNGITIRGQTPGTAISGSVRNWWDDNRWTHYGGQVGKGDDILAGAGIIAVFAIIGAVLGCNCVLDRGIDSP